MSAVEDFPAPMIRICCISQRCEEQDISKSYLPLSDNFGKTSTQVRESFLKMDALNQRIQEALAPDSDLRFGAVNAMYELSEMSKSLKSLADLLERNPQALLRGKGGQDD